MACITAYLFKELRWKNYRKEKLSVRHAFVSFPNHLINNWQTIVKRRTGVYSVIGRMQVV